MHSTGSYFIAVHGGAGIHSQKSEGEVKRVLRDACNIALARCHSEMNSVDDFALSLVECAVIVMEDNEVLNAGYGSNLTIDGTVECDAAIISGRGSEFGSVGAVSGVKNPIRVARAILQYSRHADKLGRIPPMTLVSEGANKFSKCHVESSIVPPESLVSPVSDQQWRKWRELLEHSGDAHMDVQELGTLKDIQDTVGTVAWHPQNGPAAGVSSGGLLLKCPGRIGEAAVYGAGCWAEECVSRKRSMACSVSGTGEYIVRAMLASRIGDTFRASYRSSKKDLDPHDVLHHVLVEDIWRPAHNRGEPSPDAGILLLTTEDDDAGNTSARLWCAFTTPSMAIAYASSKDTKPKAHILRRPKSMNSYNQDEPKIYITALVI